MLLLLVLCFCITSSIEVPEDIGNITEPDEGHMLSACGLFPIRPMPVKIKLAMGTDQPWMTLEVKTFILKLDTLTPSLLLPENGNRIGSQIYSCSVDGSVPTENNNVAFDPGKYVRVSCNAARNWTSLSWSRDGHVVAVVRRGRCPLNIIVVGNGPSLSVTSVFPQDAGNYSCPDKGWKNMTCSQSDLQAQGTATGLQKFLEEKYWIIVVTALGSVLFCLFIMCIYMCMMRRKGRSKELVKASFIKANTARNLYVDSLNQDPDVSQKPHELTYQNFTASVSKKNNSDRYSDNSSFLDQSLDGSYLEPDGGDRLSDGDCYENTVQEAGLPEGSIDGDCYENACEKIKDGSVGTESYEDMQGSICVRNKGDMPGDGEIKPGDGVTDSESYEDMQGSICVVNDNATPCNGEITQEDDADAYENVLDSVYSQINPALKSQNKPDEKKSEGRTSPRQHPPYRTTELKQQNGDFYLSYESNKL